MQVTQLKSQMEEVDNEYSRLLAKLEAMETIKPEKGL